MHEGEALYTLNNRDALLLLLFVVLWVALIWTRRAPTADSWRAFVNVLDSRGGNILILLGGTIYSFRAAMRLFYHAIDLVVEGKLGKDDAILLMALTFVTGTVFGQFSGALMKTLHGKDEPPPANGASSPAALMSPPSAPGAPAVAKGTPSLPTEWTPKK